VQIESVLHAAVAAEVHDALERVRAAQKEARFVMSPVRDSLIRELVAADMNLSRALLLVGAEE